jgi:hypothetical protein
MILNWLNQISRLSRSDLEGDSSSGTRNPVHRLLDAAGVPWRLSRLELEERYGISKHPAYGWDVINVKTRAAIVDGLIYPLSIQVFPQFSTAYPATEFWSACYFGNDERQNIRRATKQLTRSLGEIPIAPRYNTIHCEWSFGATAVSLTTWPADMQRDPAPSNPAHKKDPRLAKGCHIAIRTGFRPPLTPIECAWLGSFVPISPIQVPHNVTAAGIASTAAHQSELEFVREPGANLEQVFGQIGRSNDGAALIFCNAQLYVIPVTDVVGFCAERMQRAKGRGGSYLQVECRTHYAGPETKKLTICSADGPDDLNELTQKIAAVIGKPFALSEYFDDV